MTPRSPRAKVAAERDRALIELLLFLSEADQVPANRRRVARVLRRATVNELKKILASRERDVEDVKREISRRAK